MTRVIALKKKYNIHIIEDCCEALGSTFDGKHVGTQGTLGTFSFYPSHQINGMGMGGAVITDDEELLLKIKSMRAWGKVVRSAKYKGDHISKYNNDVDGVLYDDQYIYTTCGWNMQMPDVAAAYARVQMERLPKFVNQRIENYERLSKSLRDLPLTPMLVHPLARPAYFGYPLTLTGDSRDALSDNLIENKIKSRPFFAGNITRHSAYYHMRQDFAVADYMMKHGMFIGVWHGLKKKQIDKMAKTIKEFFNAQKP
jgi:CDP-6-deoxy-D-xylo-4-hexulose-3-dehydrase